MMTALRNALLLGACYTTSTDAFTTPASSSKTCPAVAATSTALNRSSPGFAGFSGDDSPNRGGGGGPPPNSRRPMDDPFAPSTMTARGPPSRGSSSRGTWEEPPSVDLGGRVTDMQSNLSRSRHQSVNEDPRAFDMDRRFSQRPRGNANDPSMEPRRSWWESSPSYDGRIQGGSRHTYSAPSDRDASHTFIETDGRPLDVEMELWDGPNNTPTKVKMYSEDGRMRPMNILTDNPQRGRGNTVSVRNTGPMEFPINAGVRSMGPQPPMMGGPLGGPQMSSPPSGLRPGGLAGSEGAYLTERDLNGFTRPSSPSMARGETVQGGALRTFPLDYSVEAVQVTITSDGLPVNAKVELWGTSSHIKQLAEIYNDNGQTRPFAAIIDVPGGSNTIAVYNTGPMEYPIRVVVEPVARMDGWDGREESFGGHLAPW
mmetsp:Transcript_8626/g.18557  ORF Transcript_8626/g.18557 Transcript_8626/m.18557 type:complete len:428 (-) Transcript_8626:232-1515(-)